MKNLRSKTADDIIVSDPDAAMRRMTQATRHILTVQKPSNGSHPSKKHHKRKK
jgi:hypothetical protein